MKLISITILSLLISFTTINSDKKPLSNQETTGLNIGNTAPELDFKDPNGKNIKLSSLRGNVVLIDFWRRGIKNMFG